MSCLHIPGSVPPTLQAGWPGTSWAPGLLTHLQLGPGVLGLWQRVLGDPISSRLCCPTGLGSLLSLRPSPSPALPRLLDSTCPGRCWQVGSYSSSRADYFCLVRSRRHQGHCLWTVRWSEPRKAQVTPCLTRDLPGPSIRVMGRRRAPCSSLYLRGSHRPPSTPPPR